MAKYVGYKRPKDTKKTVKHILTYLGHYKWAFLLIAILVFISAGAGIMGTFLIKAYGAYFPEGSKRDSNGPF